MKKTVFAVFFVCLTSLVYGFGFGLSSPISFGPADGGGIYMHNFQTPDGCDMEIGILPDGDGLIIELNFKDAPNDNTYEQVFLQDKKGRRIYPYNVILLEEWTRVTLKVTWIRRDYVNNQLVSETRGGWSESWEFLTDRKFLKVLNPFTGEYAEKIQAPPPIWQRLGFIEPQKGARSVKCEYNLPGDMGDLNDWDLIVQHTSPDNYGGYKIEQAAYEIKSSEDVTSLEQKTSPSYTDKKINLNEYADPYDLEKTDVKVRDMLDERETVSTDCEKYYRMARELKDKQDELARRLKEEIQKQENAEITIRESSKEIERLEKALSEMDSKIKDAQDALARAKSNLQSYQQGIINSINRSADGSAVLGGQAPPPGYNASLGENNGLFPLDDGGWLHLKDDAAVEKFLETLSDPQTSERIEEFKKDIDKKKSELKELEKSRAELEEKLKSELDRFNEAQRALNESRVAAKSIEKANDALNGMIEELNKKYEHCKKMVDILKRQKAEAEGLMDLAERNLKSNEGFVSDGQGGSAAEDSYERARSLVSRGKSSLEYEDFTGASSSFREALEHLSRVGKERARDGCLKKLEGQIESLERELAGAKAANPKADYSRAEELIRDLKRTVEGGRDSLSNHELDGAADACAEGWKLVSGARRAVTEVAKEYKERIISRLNKNGTVAREMRAKQILEENEEIIEAVEELGEILRESAGKLDEWVKTSKKGRQWWERLRKYAFTLSKGRLRIDQNMRVSQAIETMLKYFEKSASTVKEAEKIRKEISKMIAQGIWEVMGDKLKDKFIKLSAKLAAKGLGSAVSGPFAAVWGEAWEFGAALGDWFADNLTQIGIAKYEQAKQKGICEDGVQTGDKIPVVLDVYVEIVNERGALVTGSSAEMKFKTSTADYYIDVECQNFHSAVTDEKYMNYIPSAPSSEKITAGDKELEVVEKIVTTRRVCETNYLRVIINIKYVVR